MATTGVVKTQFEAEHQQYVKNVKAAGQSLVEYRSSARAAGEEAKRTDGIIASLKAGAGRGSELDEIGKTLRGAGAVAGLTLMGEAVKGVAEEAAKLSAEFRKGQIDAVGIGVKLAEGIPVIGNFVTAGQAIRELFTHEKEEIDAINEEIRTGEKAAAGRLETQKRITESVKEHLETMRKLVNEQKLADASTPTQVRTVTAAVKLDDRKSEGESKQTKWVEERKKDYDKDVANAREHAKAIKKTLEDQAVDRLGFAKNRYGDFDDHETSHDHAIREADFAAAGHEAGQLAELKKKFDDDVAANRRRVDQEVSKAENVDRVHDQTERAAEARKQFDELAAGARKVGDAFAKTFEEARKKVAEQQAEIKKRLEEMRRDAAQTSMSEAGKRADDFARDNPGASARDKADAERYAKQKDAAEAYKKDFEDAKRMAEESLKPIDKFAAQTANIKRYVSEGLLTIDQANAALDKASKDDFRRNRPKSATDGITERRFDFRLPKEGAIADIPRQQLDAAKQQIAQLDRSLTFFQQFYDWLRNPPTSPPVPVDF